MKKINLFMLICCAILLTFVSHSYAQTFTNVAASAGVNTSGFGHGASWADFDNDGDTDLYVAVYDQGNALYRNNGDGTFTNITGTAGVTGGSNSTESVWGDFDNDGDLDVFVGNGVGSNNLYRNNGDNTFTDIGVSSGVSVSTSGDNAAWGDFDNDGYLDLFFAINGTTANKLYQNNGNSTFTDIAANPGINMDVTTASMSPIWGDYDNDGDQDLYTKLIGVNNPLYRNNGDGTFTNVATSAGVNYLDSWGGSAAWGDFDNDGYLDIYLGNNNSTNLLYHNNGDGTFTNIASSAGVADGSAALGGGWADYDNDGDIDYYLHNNGSAKLYRNNNDNTFTDVASAAGVTGSNSPGSGWADYDNDGDMDLYLVYSGANTLYRNNGNSNKWLHLNLSNNGAGGIGARVTAVTGSLRQRRDVEGGVGHLSQPSPTVEFGFGTTSTVDSLIILWPSGETQVHTNISTNQTLSITEPVNVYIPNVIAATDTVLIPIQVDETTGNNILSAQFSVAFDSAVATFIGSELTGTLAASGWTVIDNVISGVGGIDTIKVAMFTAANALTGSGDLIYLSFDVSGSSGSTPLTLASALFNNGIPPANLFSGKLSTSGTDGLVSATPDTVIPRETFTITVVDPDENKLNHVVDSFQVLTFEAVYPDSETVWLVETGVATNTFTGTLTTEYNTSAIVSNGVMSVVAGDSVTIAYTDSIDSGGSLVTRLAYVQVIGGVDGVVTTAPDTITPGKTVTLTVTDSDKDLDVAAVDSVFVQLFALALADTESVWLQETGVNTGAFTGTFPTEYNVSATVFDGILSAALSDSICLAYVDSLTSVGSVATLNAYTEVIPYDDGVVEVSYVVQALNGQGGVRDTVRVRVFDTDLDLDVGTPDQASVTITNVVSSEVEGLTLTETGNNTGIFQLRVPTIQGASGTDNDGVLTIASWDTLGAAYIDVLTSTAVSDTLRDTTYAVNLFGDAQRNDQVQAFDSSKILNFSVGAETPAFRDSLVSDLDGDGFILAVDATYVSQYVVSIINRFAVQTDSTFSSPSDSLKNHPFLKPALGQSIVAFGDPLPQTDGTYLLPVELGDRAGVLSGTFQIGHDPNIQVLNVIPATPFQNHIFAHNPQSDNLRIAFSGTKATEEGQGNVFFIQLRTQNDVPIHLTLDGAFLNGQNILSPVEVIEHVMQESALPDVYALHPNAPNPFNPDTVIRYDLPEAAQIQVVIYNVGGQQVRTLVSAHQQAGRYQIIWNGKDDLDREVSSGIYLMRMQAASFLKTQKMLLLK